MGLSQQVGGYVYLEDTTQKVQYNRDTLVLLEPFPKIDICMVGAGGPGGDGSTLGDCAGGGGGGGQVIISGNTYIGPGSYDVVVGNGSHQIFFDQPPYNGLIGNSSSIGTLIAYGGGEGGFAGSGVSDQMAGKPGGNGGGATYDFMGFTIIPIPGGSPDYGYNGNHGGSVSAPFGGDAWDGSGANGAGAGAGDGATTGKVCPYSGIEFGIGGLGNTVGQEDGTNGVINTGQGGQGGGYDNGVAYNGGTGGSGIVGFRYILSETRDYVISGGTITHDNPYVIHTFTSNGTITVTPRNPVVSATPYPTSTPTPTPSMP